MNDNVKRLREQIEREEQALAALKAELAEAEKFQPFSVVIQVTDQGQAKALRKLAGLNRTMGDILNARSDGEFSRDDAHNALTGALSPLWRLINTKGVFIG